MCNAWNHPPGCTCGFGGEGHLGRRSYGNSFYSFIIPSPVIFNSYKSYTTPNAKCPVCGEKVFFYQNEAGSRVYFDELGPPWPKHPCTASFSMDLEYIPLDKDETVSPVNPPSWKKDGWSPIYLSHKKDVAPEVVEFLATFFESKTKIKIYIKKVKGDAPYDRGVHENSIAQAKEGNSIKGKRVWEISYLDKHGHSVCVFACESMLYIDDLPDIDGDYSSSNKIRNNERRRRKRSLKKRSLRGKQTGGEHDNKKGKRPHPKIKNNVLALKLSELLDINHED